MPTFDIPRVPTDLEGGECSYPLVDLVAAGGADVKSACSEVLLSIKNSEAWGIDEQDILDAVYTSIKHFKDLPGPTRIQLARCLGTKAAELASTLKSMGRDVAPDPDTQLRIRNAIAQSVFFLSWALRTCVETQKAEEQEAGGPRKGRKAADSTTSRTSAKGKAAKGGASDVWSCETSMEVVICGLAKIVTDVDLSQRYTDPEALRVLSVCSEAAIQLLGHASASKSKQARAGAYAIVSALAGRKDMTDSVSRDLFELARKEDHTVALVVEAAVYDAARARAETRNQKAAPLAIGLLTAFLSTHPSAYDEEKETTATSVKQAGELIAGMTDTEALAQVVDGCLPQLMPYLDCNASSIRSCMIQTVGALIRRLFAHAGTGTTTETHEKTRIASKAALLGVLEERLLDKAAHTRVRVLKELGQLFTIDAVNLPNWPRITRQVFDRLSDSSTLVQKEALKTLIIIIEQQRWSHSVELDSRSFHATLTKLEQEFQELYGDKLALAPDVANDQRDALEAGKAWAAEQQRRIKKSARGKGRKKDTDAGTCSDEEADGSQADDDAMDTDTGGPEDEPAEGRDVVGTETQIEQILQPTQAEAQADDFSEVQLRDIIAKFKTGLEFTRCIDEQLPALETLLRVGSADVIQESINLIVNLKQRGVPDTDRLFLSILSCVFSSDTNVVDTVLDAFYNLLLNEKSLGKDYQKHATGLIELLASAHLNHYTSLEAVMAKLCNPPADVDFELKPEVVAHIIRLVDNSMRTLMGSDAAADAAAASPHGAAAQADRLAADTDACWRTLHGGLYYLAIIAAHMPLAIVPHKVSIVIGWIRMCFVKLKDATSVRLCCVVLRAIAPTLTTYRTSGNATTATCDRSVQDACEAVLSVMSNNVLGRDWYGPAEAALDAFYALHPAPERVLPPFLQGLLAASAPHTTASHTEGNTGHTATSAVSWGTLEGLGRVCFLAAHTAVNQLASTDTTVKRIQSERAVKERQLLEAREALSSAGGSTTGAAGGGRGSKAAAAAAVASAEDEIAAVAGQGAGAADAALDTLRDRVDLEILEPGSVLHGIAQLNAQLCKPESSAYLQADSALCANLLLSLGKFMMVDLAFCRDNMNTMAAWLANTALPPGARCNVIIAFGDLARRWPNEVQPIAHQLQQPLYDASIRVRRTCFTVLAHLILNDVIKVKSVIVSLARCLVDTEREMSELALGLFTTLAQRTTTKEKGSGNPLVRLLPDMLSSLYADEQFERIMELLLPFVKDSKQCESVKEKLCQRFEALYEAQAASASELAAATAADRAQRRAAASETTSAMDTDATTAAATQPDGTTQDNHQSPDDNDAMDVDPMDVDEDDGCDTHNTQQDGGDKTTAQPAASGTGVQVKAEACEDTGATTGPVTAAGQDGAAQDTTGEDAAVKPAKRAVSPIVKQWRALAHCLKQLPHTAAGSKSIMDSLPKYKHALGDTKVYVTFLSMAEHTRKSSDKKGELHAQAKKYMQEITEIYQTMRMGLADDDALCEDSDGAGECDQATDGDAATAATDTQGQAEQPQGSAAGTGAAASGGRRSTRQQGATSGATSSATRGRGRGARGGASRATARGGRAKKAADSDAEEDSISDSEPSGGESADDAPAAPAARGARGGRAAARPASSSGAVSQTRGSSGAGRAGVARASGKAAPAAGRRATTKVKKEPGLEDDSEDDDAQGGRDQEGDSGDDAEGPTVSQQARKMQQMRLSSSGSTSQRPPRAARGRALQSLAEDSD